MNKITEPLQLAVGSHEAGSGKGCAMNVVSWINGDTTITDMPDCADPMLSRIVQSVNDDICTHRDDDLLCPACSSKALELGLRTIGTAGLLPDDELRVVWVRVACRVAREVAHLNVDPRVMAAIEAAEAWCDDPTKEAAEAARAAANDAYAAAAYAAAEVAYAARAAARAAACAARAVPATAAAYATTPDPTAEAAYAAYIAYADAYDAYTADDAYADALRAERLRFAHLAIDTFNELTGRTEHAPEPEQVQTAARRMVTA